MFGSGNSKIHNIVLKETISVSYLRGTWNKFGSISLSIRFTDALQFRNVKPRKMKTRREKEQENVHDLDIRSTAEYKAKVVQAGHIFFEWREEKKYARKLH